MMHDERPKKMYPIYEYNEVIFKTYFTVMFWLSSDLFHLSSRDAVTQLGLVHDVLFDVIF